MRLEGNGELVQLHMTALIVIKCFQESLLWRGIEGVLEKIRPQCLDADVVARPKHHSFAASAQQRSSDELSRGEALRMSPHRVHLLDTAFARDLYSPLVTCRPDTIANYVVGGVKPSV